jgi:AP2-associated kinase
VAHRDLKPENVLIAKTRSAGNIYKLCDFGSCSSKSIDTSTIAGRGEAEEDVERNTTIEFRAPEMCDLFRGHVLDTRVDVWALGVLLYRLAFYALPFEQESNLAILNGNFEIPPPGTARNPYSANVGKVITACLQQEPAYVSSPRKRIPANAAMTVRLFAIFLVCLLLTC